MVNESASRPPRLYSNVVELSSDAFTALPTSRPDNVLSGTHSVSAGHSPSGGMAANVGRSVGALVGLQRDHARPGASALVIFCPHLHRVGSVLFQIHNGGGRCSSGLPVILQLFSPVETQLSSEKVPPPLRYCTSYSVIGGPVFLASQNTTRVVLPSGDVTVTIGTAGGSFLSRTPIFTVIESSGSSSSTSTLSSFRPSLTSTVTV